MLCWHCDNRKQTYQVKTWYVCFLYITAVDANGIPGELCRACTSGLVNYRKDGKWMRYALNPEAFETIRGFLNTLASEK